MFVRTTLIAAATAVTLLSMQGCAVSRGQSTVGEYIDDSAITTRVKARFVENKQVDASSISVETLNGEVILSGFAKNADEKVMAERIARDVKGVKGVRNSIAIRG